ncbi:rhomboid family intramembrane serine protease [Flavobacteriaceae bacterium]|nr:rhomboid family intramembrane serine protease [Flavobacteriaceae bacterium]MBT4232118.1 rhomboid family intramembrane serine protease [Flavobacteriaceae bacterium]MBT5392617.1 rhomboid family intramembrane serine protease [Flavobacteriaceae bacterium]MBT7574990.1 rhomboid family intramembrane serine protease [Flavobacteriaceae bacterium]MDA9827328.1 rhomboid family intramembrane serine protease [Flavobacteriaceae bacterium]
MIIFFVFPYLINTIIFLFNLSEFSVINLFDVSPNLIDLLYKPWSLITYGFFHSDLWHLTGNMIILYLSGSVVLNLFGSERLIKIFVLGILYGSLAYLISYNLFPAFNNIKSSMIGSSAGVMAVFIFLASYSPNYSFRILTFNFKIIYIASFLILLDVIQIPSGNSGGHIAHLGGAFSGYFFHKKMIRGDDYGNWIISFYNFIFKRKVKFKKRNYTRKTPVSRKDTIVQKKIDMILDKISKSGYDSLTKKEKETLFKAGKS